MLFEYADYARRIADLRERAERSAEKAGTGLTLRESAEGKFRLVFAGQFSAGKSTIIKALTGIKDIRTGAGITTDSVQSYDWSGIEVTDTPGIHTEKRPDHDKLSYDAIASADMLVFVVTNELFDSNLAEHFRKLAIDQDKAGEMILVVNKMTRTARGNTPEQQKEIRDALADVIKPYTPEELGLCFTDAGSYLRSLEVREKNPAIAQRLSERSGYEGFVATLNRFVREKHLSSQLTTRLYELDDFLQKAIAQLDAGKSESGITALEDSCLRQRHVLADGRLRLQQDIGRIYTNAASKIREFGAEAENCLEDGSTPGLVVTKLQLAMEHACAQIEISQNMALAALSRGLESLDLDLGRIEEAESGSELRARLEKRDGSLTGSIREILSSSAGTSHKAGKLLSGSARNAAVAGGWKLASIFAGNVSNLVREASSLLGFRFRPWEAIRFSRAGAATGQILSVFGVVLSVSMQIKSDRDAADRREQLKRNRQNIRSQFAQAASELEEAGREFTEKNVTLFLDSAIEQIDGNIRKIRESRLDRSDACMEMESLRDECLSMIKEIHAIQDV